MFLVLFGFFVAFFLLGIFLSIFLPVFLPIFLFFLLIPLRLLLLLFISPLPLFFFVSTTLLRHYNLQFPPQCFFYQRNLLRLILNLHPFYHRPRLFLLPLLLFIFNRGKVPPPLCKPEVYLVLNLRSLFRHYRYLWHSRWLEGRERDLLDGQC